MTDLRLTLAAPLLGVLACTASYPEGRPDRIVVADDLDDIKVNRPPRTPRPGGPSPSDGTMPFGDQGRIGSGDSTSLDSRGGYSGSRGFENFGGRGTRVPTVRQAKPEIDGALDKELVRRTVRAHINEVRRCYDKALGRDPNAKGRIAIGFEIGVKGKVSAASVQESTMKDLSAGECIAVAVAGWKFPKPRTGTVKVVYPFVLEPG